RSYAAAYRDLFSQVMPGDSLSALSIDTLHLTVQHTSGPEEVVVLLPCHPARALWYSAYSDLLRHWEEELLQMPRERRRRALDLAIIDRVEALNFPCFVPSSVGSRFVFA